MTDHDSDGIPRIHEFVLGLEPRTPNALPSPVYIPSSDRLEWRLPLRETIGSLDVRVEQSQDLSSWSAEGVGVEPNGQFSIPAIERHGFLRLVVDR